MPSRRRRPLLCVLAAAACAGGLAAATSAQTGDLIAPGPEAPVASAGHGALRRVDVHPAYASAGRAVAPNLVGLSIEWPLLASDLGQTGTPPPALVDAFRALGRPPLRIGGNSQDRMWPVRGNMPVGAVWAPTPAFWAGLGRLDALAGSTVEVGLDLAHADAHAARAIATAADRVLPRGPAVFSLGNEPDRYGVQRWARIRGGRVTTARPRSWSFRAYLRQYRAIRTRLGAVGPLRGPDYADPHWRRNLRAFVAAERPQAVTVHAYPLNVCGRHPGTKAWPTGHKLLARSSWTGEIRKGLGWALDAAHRAHRPLIISEANSVACRGARGVSDAPAAALWAPAFLLSAAHAGVRQVNLHASDSAYDPFWVRWGPDGAARLEPSALFDGLVFTHRALGPGARLLPVRSRPAGAPAWAARGSDGRVRVLVENLDAHHGTVARVSLPAARGEADLSLMTRAGRDTAGHRRMAIDGQVLVDRGGRLVPEGTRTVARLRITRGRVRVTLPPMSAAVVTSPPAAGSSPGAAVPVVAARVR